MTLEKVSSQLKQVIGRFFWNVVDSPRSREAKQDVVNTSPREGTWRQAENLGVNICFVTMYILGMALKIGGWLVSLFIAVLTDGIASVAFRVKEWGFLMEVAYLISGNSQ